PAAAITAASHRNPTVHEALQRRTSDLTARGQALYEFDLYFVVVHESPGLTHKHWGTALSGWIGRGLSAGATRQTLEADVRQARATLHNKTLGFVTQLADTVAPVLLGKRDAFRFFRHLVNYTPWKREVPSLK